MVSWCLLIFVHWVLTPEGSCSTSVEEIFSNFFSLVFYVLVRSMVRPSKHKFGTQQGKNAIGQSPVPIIGEL